MTSNGSQRINRLLSRKEAANFLSDLGLAISAQTLARLFCEKKGPLCMRVYASAQNDDLVMPKHALQPQAQNVITAKAWREAEIVIAPVE